MPRKKINLKKGKGKKKMSDSRSSLKRLLFRTMFMAVIWLSIAVFAIVAYYAYTLPDVSKINENIRQPSITLYDRDNKVIATIGDLYGDYVKFQDFPKTLIDAVTSTEDRKFFKHSGVDLEGMARAFFVNTAAGRVVQGGSTITQQLAKIVYLSHERTFKRKIQELALALYLENKFTKEQILTMYLNRIYTGSGNYGMDAAAQSYFGKKVSEINLMESAILAGLIKAPTRYSPVNNPDLALGRAEQVLMSMVDNGKLKESALPKSGKLTYNFQPARVRVANKAPYFTDWIREQLPDYIGQYTSGNIEIYTTLDTRLQKLADDAIERSLAANSTAHKVSQGAMVVMTPEGEVLAITGGKSYAESQFNRATQALRQPGSAFKLFVYLAALEKGYDPDSMMEDSPIKMRGWSPENYDNKYLGEVSLREAFSKSINTIAVKLAKDVGMNKITSIAYKLGITADINKDLSSALGTSEVTLMELSSAYAHLANNGNSVWTHGITEVKTNGVVAYKRKKSSSERVLSEDVTQQMNDMLVNVVTSGTGKNAISAFDVAGKTGTTQNLRDVWFIGFTSDYVAGVWMGNDDNTSMDKIVGGTLPAILWKEFMRSAEAGKAPGAISSYAKENAPDAPKTESKESIWGGILNTFSPQKDAVEEALPWKEPLPSSQQETDAIQEEPVAPQSEYPVTEDQLPAVEPSPQPEAQPEPEAIFEEEAEEPHSEAPQEEPEVIFQEERR